MYWLEKTTYERGLKLGENDKYIVVGDSRSVHNINPAFVKGLKNRSSGGNPWCVWFARMKDFMRANQDGVKRVFIVEVYPRLLAVERRRELRDCDYDKAIFWVFHPELHERVPFKNVYLKFFQNEFPSHALLAARNFTMGKPFPGFYNGGFKAPAQDGGYSHSELLAQSDEQEAFLEGFRLSVEEAEYLEEIVNTVRQSGWDIVFVTYPTFPDPRAKERKIAFRNDMQSLCERLHVNYINLSEYGQDESLWLDIVHERRSGVEVLWRAFAENFNGVIPGLCENQTKTDADAIEPGE